MKPLRLLLALLASATLPLAFARATPPPEDVQLRQRAVQLLERANSVSALRSTANVERVESFLAFDPSYGTREGSFSRVQVRGTGLREESTFGSYHAVNVWAAGHLATVRTSELAPPEIVKVRALTPIWLVRFDHEDIIQSIEDREIGGHLQHCVEFDTVAGEKTQNNELCVDAENGTLSRVKAGAELVENSDFFPIAGALRPAKIRYSVDDILKLEITQSITLLTDAAANVLEAPPNAQIRNFCRTFQRAFGQFMPQPEPGKGGGATSDVLLRGMIWPDGKVHEAVVQSSDRPDLNAEALKVIQQWVFTPSLCDGKPNAIEATFTLHFQGR